jgi:hypothetical protein
MFFFILLINVFSLISSLKIQDAYWLENSLAVEQLKPTYTLQFPHHLKKRSELSQLTNRTKSFSISLTCQNSTFSTCQKVLVHLSRAVIRIEQLITLSVLSRIEAQFQPIACYNDVTDNCVSSVLGQASPTGWFTFTQNESLPVNADAQYAYPSTLMRQWLPNDPGLNQSSSDIQITFNSQVNWWFALNATNPLGQSYSGEFGSFSSFMNDTLKSFDFEAARFFFVCSLHHIKFK